MSTSLYQRYLQAKETHPGKYARDMAELLGVSEAELLHARVGNGAQRLLVEARPLLAALQWVGTVKSITRNSYAVHEQIGRYSNQNLTGHAGLILNPRALDLRLFFRHWASVFTLSEETRHGMRHSIQCFDHQGDAVHKIYAIEETDMSVWQELLTQFTSQDNPALQLEPASPATSRPPNLDHAQLDAEWRAMTDVHQLFPLLHKHNLSRQQLFRAVEDDLAYQVDNSALAQLLYSAQQTQNEIMIFVSNRGCVQIFTGKLEKVTPHHEWINVFNPHFTLHLIETAIAESWVTRKPTQDGMVTSLELFAADGTQIAQLYGQRTEGQPEQTTWREHIALLTRKDNAA